MGQTSAMFLARRSLRILLAFLLVFSQQQGILHLLGHDLAQLTVKKRVDTTDPQELVCAKCLTIAHLDHALAGGPPALALPVPVALRVDVAFAGGIASVHVDRYRSRAPPLFS
jgi:hypothetical protein